MNDQIQVVRLHLCLVRSTASADRATFFTAMHDHVSAPWMGFCPYRAKRSAARIGTVAGVDVYVQGIEAERAMVARGVAKRQDLAAAMCANKAVVIFLKDGFLHGRLLFVQNYLPTQNLLKMCETISSLTALPSPSESAPSASSRSPEAASMAT